MKILLCTVPDGSLEPTEPMIPRNGRSPNITFPLGILRILQSMESKDYEGEIYDINNLRHSDEQLIENFNKTKPDVVGLSAVFLHCYPHLKRIAKIIRDVLPDAWIVVGGNITSSSNVILNKTEVDVCVVGDGEKPFNKLLEYINLNPNRKEIDIDELLLTKGLSFLDESNELIVTGNAEQMTAPEMQYVDFERYKDGLEIFGGDGNLIYETFDPIDKPDDLKKYLLDQLDDEGMEIFNEIKGKKIGRIQTSKGCVARCTFCQRAQKGYRVFEPDYFEEQVLRLKNKYNVGALIVDDENFGSNKVQAYACARIMKKHGVYWSAEGARVSSVTLEDLVFYKEHNMVAVRYGLESGSQKILDIMEKKIKLEDVFQALTNCKKAGVRTTTDAFMVGMPGESRETVIESAKFVARLRFLLDMDWENSYPNWTISIPGTPLYEYCQQIGVIGKTVDEEEDYMYRTALQFDDHGVLNYLNKTDFNRNEIYFWTYLYRYAGKKAFADLVWKKNKTLKNKIIQTYKHCIKFSYDVLKYDYNRRKKQYQNKKFFEKIKWYYSISAKFLLSVSTPIIPMKVLIQLVKLMSDFRYSTVKKYKVINGRQKYNFFVDSANPDVHNLTFKDKQISTAIRPIERSLRTIVMKNRAKINPPMTTQEKAIELLSTGR